MDDLEGLLNKIKSGTQAVQDAANLLSQDQYNRVKALLDYNDGASNLLDSQNKQSSEWINDAVRFLYGEFIYKGDWAHCPHKLRKLIQISNMVRDSKISKEINQSIKPLHTVYNELMVRASMFNGMPEKCLIITAVPVEFRAIVRRLNIILSSDTISTSSPSQTFDGFKWAFNINNDTQKVRPFLLEVKGVIANQDRQVKVTILLIPGYGPNHTQKSLKIAEERLVTYEEALVVGIAGKISNLCDAKIGDVGISLNIFNGSINKDVPKSMGFKQYPFKNMPWRFGSLKYSFPNNWRPKIYEHKPSAKKYKNYPGFKNVIPCDFVSTSTLSKSLRSKNITKISFPSCLGIEMEAVGCCTELEDKNIPVRIIKGFCDEADYRKDKVWQPYCADVAAAVAFEYIVNVHGEQI